MTDEKFTRPPKREMIFELNDSEFLTTAVMSGQATTGDFFLIASAAIRAALENGQAPKDRTTDHFVKISRQLFICAQIANGYDVNGIRGALMEKLASEKT